MYVKNPLSVCFDGKRAAGFNEVKNIFLNYGLFQHAFLTPTIFRISSGTQ